MARKKETTGIRILGLGAGDQRSRSSLPKSFLPPAPSPQPLVPHSAFTLTELLVVITIIAILASLITAAAVNALNASKRARISLEINQLGQSMEEFKNKYGAYPPNLLTPSGLQDSKGNYIYNIHENDLVRAFKKAFPRSNEPPIIFRQLAGDSSVGGTADAGGYLTNGLDGAEAIYFWLGGFSEDPQYPISGPGGPSFLSAQAEEIEGRDRIYEFDLGRLGPRDENSGVFHDMTLSNGTGRFIEYTINLNGVNQTRRINFWRYTPSGSKEPYVYFDASRHRAQVEVSPRTNPPTYLVEYAPWCYETPDAVVRPLLRLNESIRNRIEFANNNKFQILHAGLDDTWGPMGTAFEMGNVGSQASPNVILFPAGPFTGDIADTLTNFTSGTLESAQE